MSDAGISPVHKRKEFDEKVKVPYTPFKCRRLMLNDFSANLDKCINIYDTKVQQDFFLKSQDCTSCKYNFQASLPSVGYHLDNDILLERMQMSRYFFGIEEALIPEDTLGIGYNYNYIETSEKNAKIMEHILDKKKSKLWNFESIETDMINFPGTTADQNLSLYGWELENQWVSQLFYKYYDHYDKCCKDFPLREYKVSWRFRMCKDYDSSKTYNWNIERIPYINWELMTKWNHFFNTHPRHTVFWTENTFTSLQFKSPLKILTKVTMISEYGRRIHDNGGRVNDERAILEFMMHERIKKNYELWPELQKQMLKSGQPLYDFDTEIKNKHLKESKIFIVDDIETSL